MSDMDSSNDVYPSSQITVQAGQQVKMSEIKKDTPHPDFQESFVFLLGYEQADDISIRICDVDTGSELGTIMLSVVELTMEPIQRKILTMNPDKPFMTAALYLSAKIKYC